MDGKSADSSNAAEILLSLQSLEETINHIIVNSLSQLVHRSARAFSAANTSGAF